MAWLIAGTSCGSSVSDLVDGPPTTTLDPLHRVVLIETDGCGFASGRTGSGVAIGDGLVITVAHLIARADGISVATANGEAVDASVVAVDLNLDLAILRLPATEVPAIELPAGALAVGDTGRIVGGATSGTVPFEVKQVVRLSIEEVLGSQRHARLGYELAAKTTTGDSGAGAYDDRNRLIGIVFATSDEGESTWITSSAEIADFLAAHQSGTTPIECDPQTSQLDLP